MLLLCLTLCSIANATNWQFLRFESDNFENLDKLHEEITTKRYSKGVLDQAWSAFENKCGSYKQAQHKWWGFLKSKVQAQQGKFQTVRLLKEGRMGSAFEIKFQRSLVGPFRQQRCCLKLPSSFKGQAWEDNLDEFAMAKDFKDDQEDNPCSSIIEHIDIQHAAGRGSYILLPLLDKDLTDAKLSSDQAVTMMEDLLMACNNLHSDMQRVHGDLLKGNIMTTRHNRRFVVIDVLSAKVYNKDNIMLDLGNIKDFPLLCFKADVKDVSDKIGHFVKAAGKQAPRSIKKYFSKNPFTGKSPTITVSKFKKLAAALTGPVRETLGLPYELSGRTDRLAGSIAMICEMSSRISELCDNAGSVQDASGIAGQVLTEFFSNN